MSDTTSWWQVVVVPAAFASIPGMFKIYQWWSDRGDKVSAQHLTADERRQATMLAEREQLTREQRETFERVEAERDRAIAEADRLRARIRDLEHDRTRGWDLARYWNRRAQDLRHVAANAQQVANNLMREAGRELLKWPDMTLLGFEEPKDND